MNRLVSILLIATFVLGPLWPHSHTGASQVDSSDHANCVHVHLRAASTDASSPVLAPSENAMDHDADAIYIADVKWAYHSSSLARVVVDTTFDLAPWASPDARSVQPDSDLCISDPELRRCSEPPERPFKLPNYLLQTALRV